MKKLLTILHLVLLVSLSTEVSFSQSNQEDCDLLCQMVLSNQTETQTLKKEVPSDKLVQRQGIFYEVNSTTPFTGSSVGYYDNSQLETKKNYKDGKLHGLYVRFYKNGLLKGKLNNKDGKLHGLFEKFYENGQLESRINYKEGKEEGLVEFYYESGQIQYRGNYKNGELDGLIEGYHENGQLSGKENYKNGVLQE